MDNRKREEAKKILVRAFELPANARRAFLNQQCNDDSALRQEVESLLEQRSEDAQLSSDETRLHVGQSGDKSNLPNSTTMSISPLPENALRAGLVLGERYRVEGRLGRGGMGEVWRAYDLKLCVEVALKSIRLERLGDPEWREMLRHEVRAARGVLSPNVCRIFDLVEADEQEFLSMEYVDGATLLETLKRRGPLELHDASAIAAQFLSGLEAIHTTGLVHRDLKPENIMITRSGRVVIMDLGVARSLTAPRTGTIAGTPGYMAPEQARGEAVDARADVFSAGIVLAELLAQGSVWDQDNLREFVRRIHADPPDLPETAWRSVLLHAIAADREARYPSATSLARALEKATQRAAGPVERSPYPGLASFTTAEAEFFFGREAEVEVMWKRLQRLHLLAVVGPSGAGKSSFLRAGLIPAIPEGWSHVMCVLGVSPFVALGQALAPHLVGDSEVVQDFLRFQEPDVAASLFARWRRRHRQALLVLDQFEELFTLNPPETRQRFADLIGRLSIESDVHVLLSMRDDFLFRCHEHPELSPILAELTLLGAPRGSDLRRAITLPALACGYRFEDDALVDEMVAQVSEERGALPLLAFASARLWDLRDKSTGLLTREAYSRIGGVGGALAQHAGATYERIAPEHQSIVREIFRNLVTAEGTRVACDRDELLSIFDQRASASSVLDELVDARLLTSFDVGKSKEDASPQQRVEIIHESLLAAWPLLVRWRTQDTEGAQLRDQLRQAAQMWRDRGQPEDLLWTGTVYREFGLWRERYPDRLTGMEAAFARAMEKRAQRRRQRRRALFTSTLTVLFAVLAVVATLWLRSERAQVQAVAEARRAEAGKLFALAQTSQQASDALAYVLASLELADQPEARWRAIKLLYEGPTRFQFSHVPDAWNPKALKFSPDGRWLAVSWSKGQLQLHPLSGGPPVDLAGNRTMVNEMAFDSTSRYLVCGINDKTMTLYKVGDSNYLHRWSYDGSAWPYYSSKLNSFLICETPEARRPRWETLSPDGSERHDLGELGSPIKPGWYGPAAVDPDGSRIVNWTGNQVFIHALDGRLLGPPRLVASQQRPVMATFFDRQGQRLATLDGMGEVRVNSIPESSEKFDRVLHGGPTPNGGSFDHQGARLAVGFRDGIRIWNLGSPEWMEPILLGNIWILDVDFHPTDQWVVASTVTQRVLAWPLSRAYPLVIPRAAGESEESPGRFADVAFSPDGRWLATARFGTIRLWPLDSDGGALPRDLLHRPGVTFVSLQFDPSGATLVAVGATMMGDGYVEGHTEGGLVAIPTQSGRVRSWHESTSYQDVCIDPTGRFIASWVGGWGQAHVVVVDLLSGEKRTVQIAGGRTELVGFATDGRLIVATGNRSYSAPANADTSRANPTPSKLSFQLHFYDLTTNATQPLQLETTWISDLAPGLFAWTDTKGQDWIGDPIRMDARPLHIDRDGRELLAIDVVGDKIVVGFFDGSVELHGFDENPPHLLLGHENPIHDVAIDPRGRWIATGDRWGNARLWPIPRGVPLQALPRDELLAKLRSLTNHRAIPDSTSLNGYSIRATAFPGWEPVPTW